MRLGAVSGAVGTRPRLPGGGAVADPKKAR